MKKKKILVVEDDEELSYLLKIRLESKNYEVVLAHSGDEALRKTQEELPDLIILDIFLPHMDGYTVMKEIKHGKIIGKDEHSAKDIPIIIITGRAPMMEDLFRVEGAADFIIKPIDSRLLLAKIDDLLSKGKKEDKG